MFWFVSINRDFDYYDFTEYKGWYVNHRKIADYTYTEEMMIIPVYKGRG
jgi:hypothetical protein